MTKIEEIKICSMCFRELSHTAFYFRNKERTKSLSYCKDCDKEKSKKWGKLNKTKKALNAKRYRECHKERIHQREKEVYGPRRKSARKVYNQSPRGKYKNYKAEAKHRELDFSLTIEDFNKFWQLLCRYCGSPIETIGLDRVDNTRGYELNNIVPCCIICNTMKLTLTVESFLLYCSKIVSLHQRVP